MRSVLLVVVLAVGCKSYEAADAPQDGGTPPAGDAGTLAPASGQLTIGDVTVTPAAIGFTQAKCGTEQSQTITLKSGDAARAIDVTMEASDVFSLAEAVGGTIHLQLAPHQETSFTVKAKASKAKTASTDVIIKVAGEVEHHLAVSLATVGSNLEVGSTMIDFGDVRANVASPTQTVTFRNEGTEPLTIRGFDPAPVAFSLPSNLVVPAGGSVEATVAMRTGPAGDPILERVTPVVDGTACGALPTLVLEGRRVDADVTVSPATIDFGDVDCGAQAPATKTITVTNYAITTASYSSTTSGGHFQVSPSNGVIAAAAVGTPTVATVTVALAAVGTVPGVIDETLMVAVEGKTVPVALHARVRGALLEVSQPALSLARVTGGAGTAKVTLTNKGNVDACVRYVRSNDTFVSEDYLCSQGACAIVDDTDQVNADASTDWSVRFYNGSAPTTITATVVKCSAFGGSALAAPLCGAAPKLTITPSN
ncbi:MAG: choice-of-anchor D domain-containing protein [Labilithrix sp.]